MKRILFMGLLLGTLIAQADPAGQPAGTFEIYPLGLSDGPAMEQMVKAVAGPDATVTLDARNQRLLVLAPPERHQKIADLFAKSAVTPRNVRIEVVFSGGEIETERGASVTGRAEVERVDDVTGVKFKIRPRVVDNAVDISTTTKQQLLVASGREGRLRIGESVPYQAWIMNYGVAHGVIQQQIAWQEVGSFLVVEPTVIGDGPLVRVKITPELVGTVNGAPQTTRFAAAATEVTVADGEPVTIGGAAKDAEFYSRFLIGVSRAGSSRRLNITMTPHILAPGGSPPRPTSHAPRPGHGSQLPPTIKVWGEERAIPVQRP